MKEPILAYGYISDKSIIKFKYPIWLIPEDKEMKRSKMETKISEEVFHFVEKYFPNAKVCKLGDYYDLAKDILNLVEDHGMLPPVNTCKIKDGKHTTSKREWDDEAK